jgi:hypothetical protein
MSGSMEEATINANGVAEQDPDLMTLDQMDAFQKKIATGLIF